MDSKERDERSKKHKGERGDNYNVDKNRERGKDEKQPHKSPDRDKDKFIENE